MSTKLKTTKINSEDHAGQVTNICIPENFPLYGTLTSNFTATCQVCNNNIYVKKFIVTVYERGKVDLVFAMP